MAQYLDDNARSAVIKKIMADVPSPKLDTLRQQIQEELYSHMSPDVAAFHKKYVQTNADMFETGYYDYNYGLGQFFWGDLGRNTSKAFDSIKNFKPLADWAQSQDQQNKMREKLTKMFGSCRTVKSLHEKYPEFAKYYPANDTPAPTSKRSAKTAEELAALAEAKRLQEEAEAKRRLESFSVAASLSSMGWTPSDDNN